MGDGRWTVGERWAMGGGRDSERSADRVPSTRAETPHQCFIPNQPSPIAHRPPPISERQIVVLVFEGTGEVLEVIAAGCRGLRLLGHGRSALPLRHASLAVGVTAAAATSGRAKHDHLTNVDLRGIPRLTVLALPLPVLDAAFDINLVAFFHIALDDIRELR